MQILLSIKPQYATKIYSGLKRYEFRRSIFREPANVAYIYETSPQKMITGKFVIGKIYKESPVNLWELTKQYAGIDKESFFSYFKDCKIGYAIEIESVEQFCDPINPFEKKLSFRAPQSFIYVDWDN